jgi:hypothetical protein
MRKLHTPSLHYAPSVLTLAKVRRLVFSMRPQRPNQPAPREFPPRRSVGRIQLLLLHGLRSRVHEPQRGQEILQHQRQRLSRLFGMFNARNPPA